MKSFQQKKKELARLKDKLSKAKIAIFTSFAREGEKGLAVSNMRDLKKDLRGVESEYLVEKKTLLDKALTQLPPYGSATGQAITDRRLPINVFEYAGSMGVAFGYGDEQAAAKSIYNFAKKNPAMKYFGALWNPSASPEQAGKFMNLAEFTEFAKLPSKDIMIARLLGMMKYPITALATVLDQISKKKSV